MHVAHVTAETAERRKQNLDDVQKRAEYREAHAPDRAETERSPLQRWLAPQNAPATREGGSLAVAVPPEDEHATNTPPTMQTVASEAGAARTYVDFEGKTQLVKKKWFGLW